MLNIYQFFKNKPSLHNNKQLSDVPLSMQFYDYMYTILRSEIEESKLKIAFVELEKSRQLFYKDNPLKSMDQKLKESEMKVELSEPERKGQNFLDVLSDTMGDAFENMFKKQNRMQIYENSLTKETTAIQRARYLEIDIRKLKSRRPIYSRSLKSIDITSGNQNYERLMND